MSSWAKVAKNGHYKSLRPKERVAQDEKYHGLVMVDNSKIKPIATKSQISQALERFKDYDYEVINGNDASPTQEHHIMIRVTGTRTRIRVFTQD